MPLQTSKGYNLQPDILGNFTRGENIRFKAEEQKRKAGLENQAIGDRKRMGELRRQALGLNKNPQVESIVNAPSAQDESAILLSTGLDTPEKKKSAKDFADKAQTATDDQLASMINERVGDIVARGGDPKDTMQLLGMTPQQARQELDGVSMIVDRDAVRQMFAIDPKGTSSFLDSLNPARRLKISGVKDTPKQREFKHFIGIAQDPNSTQLEKDSARRELGDLAKESLTGEERIAKDKALSTLVAESKAEKKKAEELAKLEAQTELAPNLEKQKKLAKDAGALSTAMFKQMSGVEKNIANLEEGMRLIDEGAAVGPVDKWFPSYKAASVEMDNLKNRLGMDVIGSVTFGALSKGELDLALSTAIPPNLNPEELKAWFQKRIEPQKKLLAALEDASIFLAEDGATIPKLLAKRRQERGAAQDASSLSDDELFQ